MMIGDNAPNYIFPKDQRSYLSDEGAEPERVLSDDLRPATGDHFYVSFILLRFNPYRKKGELKCCRKR